MAFPLHPNAGDTYTNPLGTTWYYDPVENSWDLLTQAVGVTGSAGVTGVMGFTGAQGHTGAQGVTGLIGTTGLQGIDGNHGDTGQQGQTGIDGIIGLPGPQGLVGNTGAQGVTGVIGNTGAQGLTGLAGTNGNTGAQGLTGAQGNTGSAGVTGLRGVTGFRGVTGLVGQTGAQGYTGLELGVTGPDGYVLFVNSLKAVTKDLYETGSQFHVPSNLEVDASYALNATSSDSGNPWEGGGSGSPVSIDVAGKSVVRVAPSSTATQYYTFSNQENGQEIIVVNENYSTFPVAAIIVQTAADLPQHRCEYGKALKLYYDPSRGTKPGWMSVQDDHYTSGNVTVQLREGVSNVIITATGYAARAGDITVLHLPYTAPSSYVYSSAATYWILISDIDNVILYPVTSGKDCIGWFQSGTDGGMTLARFIIYNNGIYLRKAPDSDWNGAGVTGAVGFIPCVLTWTNE